ncbi:hypothetical protein F4679DRAFT_551987 [Xylaria curta]|nr:hypothetical protein F4679DRAFT_551987 [Xylaria curta]
MRLRFQKRFVPWLLFVYVVIAIKMGVPPILLFLDEIFILLAFYKPHHRCRSGTNSTSQSQTFASANHSTVYILFVHLHRIVIHGAEVECVVRVRVLVASSLAASRDIVYV